METIMEIHNILKEELVAVPQYERVAKLREVVPEWLSELESDQILIIGLFRLLVIGARQS